MLRRRPKEKDWHSLPHTLPMTSSPDSIVYGVLTDPQGRPLAVEVYPGNTADLSTVIDHGRQASQQFGLSQVVFVAEYYGC